MIGHHDILILTFNQHGKGNNSPTN